MTADPHRYESVPCHPERQRRISTAVNSTATQILRFPQDDRVARPTRHNSLHSPRRAFTLLELLLAISISAILVVSIFSALHAAFKARDSAVSSLAPTAQVESAFEILRSDLEAALPPTGTLAKTFTGTDQSDDRGYDGDYIGFYGTGVAPQHDSGNGEVKLIEYTVAIPVGFKEHCLVRHVTPNLLSQVQVDPDEEVLLRGIAGFNARYYDGTQWQDNWDSTQYNNVLPSAVEVTIRVPRKDTHGNVIANAPPLQFIRVFQLPCMSDPNDTSTASSTSASGTGSTGTGSKGAGGK